MTQCCDDYGTCTRGKDCPARPAMYERPMDAKLAAAANERIRRLEAGRAHLLAISDKPGNWWDDLPWYGRLGTVCGVVLAVGLVVGLS